MNITIAGAGVTGLVTAYVLNKAGRNITLYDPDGFPAKNNASYIAGGMLAPYSEIDFMTPDFIRDGLHGIGAWAEIAETIGAPEAFAQKGSLLIAHAQDSYMLERFAQHVPGSVPHERLDHSALSKQHALLPKHFQSGITFPQEAALEPKMIINKLCAYLQDQPNITLKQENCDLSGHDRVIDCRGMAAQSDLPRLRSVKGETAIVENPDFHSDTVIRIMHPRYPLYVVPRTGNRFMIGATQIESHDDESSPSVRSALELLSALHSLHPSFGDAKLLGIEVGIRPAYPDNLPRVTQDDTIIRINGTFRHGYLLAPALAKQALNMLENTA